MISGIVVRMSHVRQAKLCSRGARAWAAEHQLDFQNFLAEGLPVEELEATGDAFALKACAVAREEASRGQ